MPDLSSWRWQGLNLGSYAGKGSALSLSHRSTLYPNTQLHIPNVDLKVRMVDAVSSSNGGGITGFECFSVSAPKVTIL